MTTTSLDRVADGLTPAVDPPVIDAPRVHMTRRARRRARLSPGRGVAAWVLATISLLLFWFVLYAVLLTPFAESRSQAVLYNQIRERLALQTAPLGGAITPGTPVALMSAPSLNLRDVVVVEGTASGDTMAGPGHRRDTVLPGQAGVSVLFGRGGLFGAPFAAIESARVGDVLTVTTGQGVFTYRVVAKRVAGDPLPQPLQQGQGRLTLVSTIGSGRLGQLTPVGTVYVDAALDGKGQDTLPGRPAAVPQAERAMRGDPSALLPLSLSLPLLLAGVLFAVIAYRRWGGWQAWVVGLPLVLLGLWLVSQAAVQLLPNLL